MQSKISFDSALKLFKHIYKYIYLNQFSEQLCINSMKRVRKPVSQAIRRTYK
jgi:hypothetical protein